MNEFSEIGANLTAEESIEGDCMWMRTRRDLLAAFASVALIKQATAKGAAGTARLAVISPASPLDAMVETSANPFWRELFGELRRLGNVEGKNLIVGRFSTEGHAERGPQISTQF
jgi:putative tryptophan/tyrosine transport system substrate-binding protein